MSLTPRYALYYVPDADHPLARLGAALLGYDGHSGAEMPPPAAVAAMPDWSALTAEPRRYGFHATLKAPLMLAEGRSEAELRAAVQSFAGEPREIPVIRPVVRTLGDFMAVVPAEASASLSALAQACVAQFDGFRAPLTEADRQRRRPDRLSERQRQNLERWGYPYVDADFRFHMTLTGRIPAERRDDILRMLEGAVAELDLAVLAIDRLALCRQDAPDARFRVLDHHPLR
jgi:putative phosphonate metabolism protein